MLSELSPVLTTISSGITEPIFLNTRAAKPSIAGLYALVVLHDLCQIEFYKNI